MYNRNRVNMLHPKYEAQQKAITEACEELGLKVYRPSYHAARNDNNTVLIYTQEAFDHNAKMDKCESEQGYRPENDMPYVCYLENSDRNGNFDLDYMNHGALDFRSGYVDKDVLKAFIRKKLEG